MDMESISMPDASTDPEFMERWSQSIMNMPSTDSFPERPSIGEIAHVGSTWSYWDGTSWVQIASL